MQPHRERKSLGSEDTFLEDIHDLARARAEVSTLVTKVWTLAARKTLRARTVVLKVKYADFRQITRSRTLSVPLGAEAEFQTLAQALLDPLFPTPQGIRLLGVTLSSLSGDEGEPPTGARQLSLW